jgi:hypothetical protein
MTAMKTLGFTFFLGGLLLAFGAVGGMDTQPEAPLYLQVVTALVGLLWMWVGTRLLKDEL